MAFVEHDACADLAEGVPRALEIDGHAILLTRLNGICHAVGATCPHAGAPLGEGILRDGVVICPWHKAAFSVATGRACEPPAVDDLPRYALRLAEGRVLVTLGDGAERVDPVAPSRGTDPRTMVLIGAGAAGAMAAQTLRGAGFGGRVVMVSREDRLPYDRTLLSKYTLSGEEGGEKSPLQDAAFYDRHRIERLTREVASVDPAARVVAFADGTSLRYDAALLATGGVPRPLEVPGGDTPGVFLLRSAADADALVAAAKQARRAVVAGTGFIGLEAAASLRERGLEVTVVSPEAEPFERRLGPKIGAVFRRLHERRGVAFRLGAEIAAVEGQGRVERVRLKDGAVLPADLVVAGLGVSPATGMLRGVARRKDGGLDVDARLRVAEGLYAAGDIAAFPLRGDGERIRVEHWRVAQQQGRTAALNMLGGEEGYEAVPYFWTIHFRKRLDYIGHVEKWDDLIVDGDLGGEEPAFVAFYVRNGRVAAVAGWDRDRAMASALDWITKRRDWTVEALRGALGG